MIVPAAVATANFTAAVQGGITFTFAGGGITGTNSAAVAISGADTAETAAGKINAAFTTDSVAGVQAVAQGGKVVFKSTGAMSQVNPNFTVTVAGDTLNTLGFGASAVGSSYVTKSNSGGVQQSVQAADTKPFTWTNITANTQTLTFGVTHPDGTLYNFDVSLTSGNAANIDAAVASINSALQASGDANLKNIVAVKEQLTGTTGQGIRFMSPDKFTVKLGSIAGAQGLKDASVSGASQQGTQLFSTASSGGGTADVSTQASAQSAVTAIGDAVKALGAAQAAVGKGQNTFNYAVSLASTQLTNLAASESRIRDADLAAEAANLSKAQILSQAGIAALAQANSAPQAVLSLLHG
jgi:flagellin